MIREPVVAGQFYSRNPQTLRRTIESFFSAPDALLEAKAVVSPHAGYVYSGAVAGAVFSSVHLPGFFVILGPNHTGRGAPLALAPAGEWRTPLGAVSISDELNRSLLAECPLLREDSVAHAREHSLEVQLPFLQILSPGFRFAAVCVGTGAYGDLVSLGRALARVIRSAPGPVLVVSSSDMTHYEPADTASRKDNLAIGRILDLDPEGLYNVVRKEGVTMCGFAPTVAALEACLHLGAKAGKLIRYANSGDASGDYASVVGYAGLAVS